MFLLTGDAKYLDVMERVIYNGVISGVSLDGERVLLCEPARIGREIQVQPGPARPGAVFRHGLLPRQHLPLPPLLSRICLCRQRMMRSMSILFVGELGARSSSTADTIGIKQETRYPWDGAVKISSSRKGRDEFSVYVRIPGWARNKPVPGDLYRYAGRKATTEDLCSKSTARPLRVECGQRLRPHSGGTGKRAIRSSSSCPCPSAASSPMRPSRTTPGRSALERGPLVYCAEGADNGGRRPEPGRLDDIRPIGPNSGRYAQGNRRPQRESAWPCTKNADGSPGGQKEQDFSGHPILCLGAPRPRRDGRLAAAK